MRVDLRAPVLWLFALLLATRAATGAPPVARVTGPARALPGDLVVLDASSSQALGYAWVLADSDKSFLPVDGGQRLVFATGAAGRYTFVLVAANANEQGQPAVALATHVLTIGSGPDPNPGPDPPAPNPPLPPGRFDLARQARDWITQVKLSAADRARTARLIASAFEGVAAAAAAGTVRSIDDALAQLRASNRAALSSAEYSAWQSGWNPSFNAAMTRLDDAGQLKTLADTAEAFREIATGLKATP